MKNNRDKSRRIKMSHGGKRPGAGRPAGSMNRRTQALAEKIAEKGDKLPLEIVLEIMNQAYAINDIPTALEAAKIAAPYIHPRLSAIEHGAKNGIGIQFVRFAEEALEKSKPENTLNISWMTADQAKKRGWI